MTKKNALTVALNALNLVNTDEAVEARATLTKMVEALSTSRPMSDEAKAKQNELRKAKTAAARAELVATVAPVLRKYLTADISAKELFEAAKAELPADFTHNKVQNVLLREMRPELVVTEAKGKANTYRLA
jgi:hypothetical protein